MNTVPHTDSAQPEMTQKLVIEFLQNNPQFLAEHPELFEVLVPTAATRMSARRVWKARSRVCE